MFLQPVEYGSRVFTQVFEAEDEFISPFKPLDIVKNSCEYYGCDYESRKKGTSHIIGYSRKLPIAIEPTYNIFFFPTTSPTRSDCSWISYDFVKEYCRVAPQQTLITFQNNQTHLFASPYSTIETQVLRTSRLKAMLMQRIQSNERKLYYLIHKPEEMKASEKIDKYSKSIIVKK
jgi:competence protein ComK